MSRSKPRYKKIFVSLLLLVLLFLLPLAAYLLHQRFFTIKSIDCQASSVSCPRELNQYLSSYLGHSLFSLDQKKLKEEIGSLLDIEDIKLKIKLPSSLQVNLLLSPFRLPVSLLNRDTLSFDYGADGFLGSVNSLLALKPSPNYLLLPSGQTLPSTDSPEISPDSGSLKLIASLTATAADLSRLSAFAKALSNQNRLLVQVVILDSQQNLLLLLNSSQVAIVPVDKIAASVLDALQQIKSTATIKQAAIIDLRFNQPVIR